MGGEEAEVVFSESKRKGSFLLGLLFRLAALIPLLTFQLMCMFSFVPYSHTIYEVYFIFVLQGIEPRTLNN